MSLAEVRIAEGSTDEAAAPCASACSRWCPIRSRLFAGSAISRGCRAVTGHRRRPLRRILELDAERRPCDDQARRRSDAQPAEQTGDAPVPPGHRSASRQWRRAALDGGRARLDRTAAGGPAVFERAIAAGPGSTMALNGLGLTRLSPGNKAGAGTAFRESLRLDPKQPDIAAGAGRHWPVKRAGRREAQRVAGLKARRLLYPFWRSFMWGKSSKLRLPDPAHALPGRDSA